MHHLLKIIGICCLCCTTMQTAVASTEEPTPKADTVTFAEPAATITLPTETIVAQPIKPLVLPSDTAPLEEPLTINQKRQARGLTSKSNIFVPKGQWIFGGSVSYSTHANHDYTVLVIAGINSNGYTFKVSPLIAYAIRDNMAIGGRFVYGRTLLKIDTADISLGEEDSGINLNLDHYYGLQQSYSAMAIWRQYIPLGDSKRFALFTEMQLSAGGSQGKFASGQPVKGTFQRGYHIGLGVAPGLVAFATNNMAIEVSVGVMGIEYTHVEQVHNQVSVGKRSTSNMNFRVNIFSIGLGFAFYL
ncbi:MAG: hypothetical protein RR330_04315 [Alistipes sp.]